jgi:hypothetical protein
VTDYYCLPILRFVGFCWSHSTVWPPDTHVFGHSADGDYDILYVLEFSRIVVAPTTLVFPLARQWDACAWGPSTINGHSPSNQWPNGQGNTNIAFKGSRLVISSMKNGFILAIVFSPLSDAILHGSRYIQRLEPYWRLVGRLQFHGACTSARTATRATERILGRGPDSIISGRLPKTWSK